MKLILLFLLAFQSSHAANYLPLSSGIQLYDVEVVVFARQLIQPDSFQVSNRDEVDLTDLNAMQAVDEDMAWLIESEKPDQDDEWQVPIDGNESSNAKALAWFAFDDLPTDHAVFNKINKHPNMRALFYQKWRQPATPYRNPGFVKISSWAEDLLVTENEDGTSVETEFESNTTVVGQLHDQQSQNETYGTTETIEPEPLVKPDYTIRGKVAFSKQRFQHSHVDVNLYRESQDGVSLVYRLTQATQIDLDQWQYFDHTQFGVMVKVSLATEFANPNQVITTE